MVWPQEAVRSLLTARARRHRDFSRLTAEFSSALCKFNATCWLRWPEKNIWLFRSRARRCINSAHSDWLLVSLSWLCLFIVSAQVMMLVYGTWATDLPRSKKICKATRGLYIHMNWNTHHRILVYTPQTYHHITTWPCTRTTTHSRAHTYMYTDTHNMNTAQIHHHNITYQNITWRIITSRHMQPKSVYLRLHTFTLLPPNLTSHENNITSHPHTHTYNMCM